MKPNKSGPEQLTEVELEMMTIIWKSGPCNVHQIMENLPETRKLAYTSVSTMVRILEQKNFLESVKEGRAHIYRPKVTKESYETRTVSHVIDKVFEGEPTALVRNLLSSHRLSQAELDELRAMIDAGRKK